jgi:5-dehydro-2-deoxygluconokinase
VTDAQDVVTMGRVGVDLYPEQAGVRLEDVRTFRKMLGGTATNVAVAAARHGRRSAVVTKVGADGFGAYVRGALAGFGVDPSYVGTHPTLRTPLAFCELFPPDDFPLLFYREPQAPDMTLTGEELPLEAIRSAGVFWVTGTGLSAEPSREATLDALRERGRRPFTVLDLDWRPTFWEAPEEAPSLYREALAHVTAAVGNREEVSVAVGETEPRAAAGALLDLGVELAVVKLGPDGVLAATSDELVEAPPVPVEVVNGLGAGDAFGGALCHGLLAEWPLERTIRFANAAGALVASRLGCADAMPSTAEVEELEEAASTA